MPARRATIARVFLPLILASLLPLSGCVRQGGTPVPPGGLELVILHTNDTHSHIAGIDAHGNASFEESQSIGGLGRISAAIKEYKGRQDNVIALDAGDQFQGTLFYSVSKWPMLAEYDKHMPWDAMTLGNHEFDEGCLELSKFMETLEFPLLAANLAPEKGCPLLKSRYSPHLIKTVRGVKVGIIGIANDEVVDLSSACSHTKFNDAAETLAEQVRRLESQGVHCIIALTHLGLPMDRKLARTVDGIDVIVGGHTHSYLGPGSPEGPYPTVESSPSGKPVLVVTAKRATQYLGELNVVFDKDGVPVSWGGSAVQLDSEKPIDQQIAALTPAYRSKLDDFRSTLIGEQFNEFPDGMDACRENECLGGLVTADAMLDFAGRLGASAAICNGGAIRASLPVGKVTKGDMLTIHPFGNIFMVREFTGEQIWEALEHGVAEEGGKGPRLIQPAGLRYTVDASRPAGKRIVKAEILEPGRKAVPLDLKKKYRIALSDYLTGGGDGYAMLKEGVPVPSPQVLIADIVGNYISRHSPLPMPATHRIRWVK
ncbi:MAG: bifunctional metallophosphatase/5'-nucleotidase [Mailhella sp.]|nr:bifunctional metallophosphatase/5'-nucleotidase [Mailhella sp.]